MPLGSPTAALPAAAASLVLTVFSACSAWAAAPVAPEPAPAVAQDAEAVADEAAPAVPAVLQGAAAWDAFDEARAQLALATRQARDPELWSDVVVNANDGLELLARAGDAVDGPRREALGATLRAVVKRQAAAESRWQARGAAGDDATQLNSIETRWTSTAGTLADDLLTHEGLLPETSVAASDLLFEAGRNDEAQAALRRALTLWPADARVHEQVRSWAGRLPRPAALIDTLRAQAERYGRNDPVLSGQSLETSAALSLALGQAAYDRAQATGAFDDYREASLLFQDAAHDLGRTRSMPRELADEELQGKRAAALINAGWAQYAVAWGHWSEGDKENDDAWIAWAASAEAFSEALTLEPGNGAAQVALSRLGTLVGTKAQGDNPLLLPPQDKADMRDYFGEIARRFDVAEWWNNDGLFSRDTGEAAAAAGDTEAAMALYERSFEAYKRAIALEPNDTRMVNDTGVMLYYYLQRDLDQAEAYFTRAIELGADKLDNPFADRSDDVWQQELAAYLDAKLNLARLYADLGRLEEASAVIDDATAFDREVFEAGDQAGVRADLLQTKARIDASLPSGEDS